mmetsp:Transcript_3703/g.8246  ORF Transcript_3703/g.8246 Transcript_3703/m.8246 type:complete len:202 (-) Transcript_3703:692-1297(-)
MAFAKFVRKCLLLCFWLRFWLFFLELPSFASIFGFGCGCGGGIGDAKAVTCPFTPTAVSSCDGRIGDAKAVTCLFPPRAVSVLELLLFAESDDSRCADRFFKREARLVFRVAISLHPSNVAFVNTSLSSRRCLISTRSMLLQPIRLQNCKADSLESLAKVKEADTPSLAFADSTRDLTIFFFLSSTFVAACRICRHPVRWV